MADSYWEICFTVAGGEKMCVPIYAKLPTEQIPNDNSDVLLVAAIDALVAQVKDEQLRAGFVEVVNDALVQLNDRLPVGVEVQRVG